MPPKAEAAAAAQANRDSRILRCYLIAFLVGAAASVAMHRYLHAVVAATLAFALFGYLCIATGHEAGYRAGSCTAWAAARDRALTERGDSAALIQWIDRRMATLPRMTGGGGYLYVILFSTGAIKVGKTADPAARLRTHRRKSTAFGAPIVNFWISPHHAKYHANEIKLITYCAQHGQRARSEYFLGLEYVDVLAFAVTLVPAPVAAEVMA